MKWLVLDTETTGFNKRDEVLEIAVADVVTGEVLYHDYCRPVRSRMWVAAEAIHGITPDKVQRSLTFESHWHKGLRKIIEEAERISAYNADFDYRLMCQSLNPRFHPDKAKFHCLMKQYAQYKRRSAKLIEAAAEAKHEWKEEHAHSALGDTLAARSVALFLDELNKKKARVVIPAKSVAQGALFGEE